MPFPIKVMSMGNPAFRQAPPSAGNMAYGKMAVLYSLLLIYGSLFPFRDWDWHAHALHILLSPPWPPVLSRSDVITNITVYMPLGLLLVLAWRRQRVHPLLKIFAATVCGIAFSVGVEYLQAYLPARVASLYDTAFDGLGTFLGAVLAHNIASHSFTGLHLRVHRRRWFVAGALADFGLLVIGLWVVSELAPLIPSVDRGTLVEGIRPLILTVSGALEFNRGQALFYALDITALGIVAVTVLRTERRFLLWFALFVCSVLLLKIPVVSRQLSLEALAGAGAAFVALSLLLATIKKGRLLIAGVMVLVAYAMDQLHDVDDPEALLQNINWIPFLDQMGDLSGLADIVGTLWPFTALAYLARLMRPRHARLVAAGGALLVCGFAVTLEWAQTHIPGRYPDITDVILAVLGWWLPWLLPTTKTAVDRAMSEESERPPQRRVSSSRRVRVLVAVVAAGGLLSALQALPPAPEPGSSELPARALPAPDALPPALLPGFQQAHPRLPAPSTAELARLRQENPALLSNAVRSAQGGAGPFEAVMLAAYAEPGSQDLRQLHDRLLALQFAGRGDQQTKAIALAYDWLYPQWNAAQRQQLLGKLASACDYQIRYIRTARLSPYNVYLYNSPLQALMACAIALYQDDPRGDAVMAFTADYWRNRVLPVWRQVMGDNGGWHEGGEYVGIGIGQAVYQLPAMWRKATGEDVFATLPGLRGFLDFLVYRTRPDDTQMRLGDAGYFDRDAPDRVALALEFQHAAAYSLRPPPKAPAPSSWPWGPLTDAALYDPHAAAQLPFAQYFDGIGLVVARSDWTPDATYVTFKAGDNFWSHSHLDQGTFTLYKGGALAIDSGLYGPDYGADHHLNYTYQTIAHNTLTVTDPHDTVPIPAHGDIPARAIANDGGQRRIGSGWGQDPAPIDHAEWREKRDLYHTGHMEQLFMEDGLIVAIADITPAYTNVYSGAGSFAHRTRRVERARRIFAYDRIDDVVVVFDYLRATDAAFKKRWLLHSLERPIAGTSGFELEVAGGGRAGYRGGRLKAEVILPERPTLTVIGGPQHAFDVAGHNYDEGVGPVLLRRPDAEPGSWRIELSSAASQLDERFLVVLQPSLAGGPASAHRITRLARDNERGVEIAGRRTTRWWFNADGTALELEVQDPAGTRVHRLAASSPPLR